MDKSTAAHLVVETSSLKLKVPNFAVFQRFWKLDKYKYVFVIGVILLLREFSLLSYHILWYNKYYIYFRCMLHSTQSLKRVYL